jgi:fructose-1,6-bisphosphatase I
MKALLTLDEFIFRKQQSFQSATGELSGLLRDIGLAAKIISYKVNRAGLADITGQIGQANSTGDEVQKLDVLADELMINSLKNSGECCGIASEENDHFISFTESPNAKYVVLFDPLDGSSNIDVNVSIGTIFAIYRRLSDVGGPCELRDFLQDGVEQVAAGYVLYGSSTMLVYTTGNGVHGFTLDPSIGEFCLSHPNIRIPEKNKYYSVNQSHYLKFDPAVQQFIDLCVEDGMGLRYIGSMVADVHRTLLKGGIFLYPGTTKSPNGKLRLLYECNPLAMLIEQAGGQASNGYQRILELEAHNLHQRTPVFMGAANLIQRLESLMQTQRVEA